MDAAGSTAGIISLGITVAKSLVQYYDSWKHAPEDVTNTTKSLEDLANILDQVLGSLSSSVLDWEAKKQLNASVTACEDGIKILQKRLNKLRRKAPPDNSNMKIKLSTRMLYPFKESTLSKLRDLVADLKSNLTLALHNATL